ncbi:MAG: stage II sporulation protein M [Chloroflexaceae bacterium]|nr:stage II sporulation protein M [Chloroflexaceae bacterium]
MLAEDFIARKRHAWERLTKLLDRAQGGLSRFTAEELQELGQLYRQATSDFAVAQRDYPRHPVSEYLHGLVGRGHAQIYRGKGGRLHQLVTFFTHTFPRTFRETWGYTLASLLMFLLPALITFFVGLHNPDAISLVFPGFQDRITDIKYGHEWWTLINEEGQAASASFIMTNNIRVAFLAFAGGVLLGLLTLVVLTQNGIMLGSIAGAAQHYDFAGKLWGFVAAHGMIELSVIFIAGGAGLQLGWSILRPGLLTRRTALVVAARRAACLVFGCVPLLIIAGTIEGFISPSTTLPLGFKLVVSFGSGVLLYGYLLLAGRARPHRGPSRRAPRGRTTAL